MFPKQINGIKTINWSKYGYKIMQTTRRSKKIPDGVL